MFTPLHGVTALTKWRDLFTDRQLVALTTFSDLVAEARERIRAERVRYSSGSSGRRRAIAERRSG